jgi:hypothetical protein
MNDHGAKLDRHQEASLATTVAAIGQPPSSVLWVRLQPSMGIGAWGALLGFLAGLAVKLLLLVQGTWFRTALLLPVFLPVVYYLFWRLLVGPVNEVAGVGWCSATREATVPVSPFVVDALRVPPD